MENNKKKTNAITKLCKQRNYLRAIRTTVLKAIMTVCQRIDSALKSGEYFEVLDTFAKSRTACGE